MLLRPLISFVPVLFFTLSSPAQVMKVKRKGVQPINVTKPAVKSSAYSLEQFNGKWQEISRKDRANNNSVDFEDTLFFIFSGDNDIYIRDGKNLSLKGKAEVLPGNILSIGADEFIIKELDKTKAVLDDGDKYIRTMIRQQSFWFETFPTDSIVPEKFANPVAVSLPAISGKWIVYRRNAMPGAISSDQPVIKMITIEDKSDSLFNGKITFYVAEKTETSPCSITVAGRKINIVAVKHTWQMDVYKAGKEEFIFGSPALMYYAKRY